MPGSSRMPVSLRNTFAVKKGASSNSQLLALNIDLYVPRILRPTLYAIPNALYITMLIILSSFNCTDSAM
jgi:hypothetical protein